MERWSCLKLQVNAGTGAECLGRQWWWMRQEALRRPGKQRSLQHTATLNWWFQQEPTRACLPYNIITTVSDRACFVSFDLSILRLVPSSIEFNVGRAG